MDRKIITLKQDDEQDYGFEESIKTLRTNLQFCGNDVRVIAFTSALPDEGKSEISFAAAKSLSQIGNKVLLIDADIRKSVFASRFGLKDDMGGLSLYLTGQISLEDVVLGTTQERLDMILAGPYAPNPSELLEEELFTRLIEWARGQYNYVIIDTPPMANLIDGAIVARNTDGMVIVIESGAVSRQLEKKVKLQLEKSGCRILGAVLNKVDIHSSAYYGHYGRKYGGYYDYYRKYDKGRSQ